MALIFLGKTACVSCGKPIEADTEVVSFPAFLPTTHALSRFSDAAFHRTCFERAPESHAVQKLYERFQEIWESRPSNLKTLEEIDAWGKEAFKQLP